MHFLLHVSLIYAFIVPLLWTIVFFIKHKQDNIAIFASHFFLAMTTIFLMSLACNSRWLGLSLITNTFYPFVLMIVPILYLFFLYKWVHNNQPLPRKYFLFFILPLIQCVFSDYVYYFHYPSGILKNNFYIMFFEPVKYLPEEFKLVGFCNLLTTIITILELVLVLILSIFLIPYAVHKVRNIEVITRERIIKTFLILISIFLIISIGGILQITSKHIYADSAQITLKLIWGTANLLGGYFTYKGIILQRNNAINIKRYSVENRTSLIKLIRYFTEKRPFLNTDLKINDVAKALGTNRTYLSQLLNTEMNTNFNQFVNKYRVKEAQNLMKNTEAQKLIKIADESGFNSYSVFFSKFKEITGKSPSEYLDLMKENYHA